MKCVYLIILVVLVAAACTSEDAPTIFVPNQEDDGGNLPRVFGRDSGTRNDSSTRTDSSSSSDSGRYRDSSTDRDGSAFDATRDADIDQDGEVIVVGGPEVEILEPLAAANPVDDDVLVETPVTVRCRVTESEEEGAEDVDPTSVMIALVVDDTIVEEKQGVSRGNHEFEATFTSSEMQGGLIAFRCSADDTATPSRSSFDEIETYYDQGPDIEIIDPEEATSISLNEQVRVEFRVVPLQLDDDDSESEIDEVNLRVAGVDIEVEEVESEDGLYRAFVDFADTVLFPNTPTGSTPIVISATNERTPEAAKRIVTYNIIVDAEGPDITILEPEDGEIVGGDVVLRFTIEDQYSAIDIDTLIVEINDTPYDYDPEGQWSIDGDEYSYRFDTRNITGSKVQITINIDVNDIVGNVAPGASMILHLDNEPPLIDLNPPWVREIKDVGDDWFCSFAFDPVGPVAVNNRETVHEMVLFRSVVWDKTNTAPPPYIPYYSTVNPETVYIYVQDDVDTPLLIDTDGDGECDDLDREGLPDREMVALSPDGTPFYGGESSVEYAIDVGLEPALEYCTYQDSTNRPDYLCTSHSSDLTRVIAHCLEGGDEPAIYAVNVVENGVACTGDGWEIGAFIQPGPFCVAVRAEDYEGNVGISPPLVLCYDNSDTPENECDGVDLSEITCADDCDPPPGLTTDNFDFILYPE